MSIHNIFNIAGSALNAQSQRMNVAASNLANAESAAGPDGQPYRAKQVMFRARNDGDGVGGVDVTGVVQSSAPFQKQYRPNSKLADDQGYVRMPNVNPTDEMVNMISAARSYKASVSVLNTTKNLMLRTLTLGE